MKSRKAQYGQFNTAQNECQFTIKEIQKHFKIEGEILEPSYGTGNFVNELKNLNVNIFAFAFSVLQRIEVSLLFLIPLAC